MSNYPKRTQQHKIDTKGTKIFRNIMPEEYIIREISERDYGIDAFVELTNGDDVLGKFTSIQIKSKQIVNWNKNQQFKMKISKSTINYWLNGNNPTYLVMVDVSAEDVYFINVGKQIRKHYDLYIRDKFSFTFNKKHNLKSDIGKFFLLVDNHKEFLYSTYIESLKDFAKNYEKYYEHIVMNIGRDWFLEVEEDDILESSGIIDMLNTLEDYLCIQNETIDFDKIRKESMKAYKSYYCRNDEYFDESEYYMIEYENTEIHIALKNRFEKVAKVLKQVVVGDEKYFWETNYYNVYKKIIEMDLNSIF